MTIPLSRRASALLLGLLAAAPAFAAGDLDPTFAAGAGYVLVPFGSGDVPNDQFQAVVVDSQGRMLAAGFRTDGPSTGGDRDFALLRLLPDGSPDPAFGPDGKRSIGFNMGGFQDGATSVYETADGGYVVCGLAESEAGSGGIGALAVARLLENGSLDTSFHFDGRRTLYIPHPAGGEMNGNASCAPAAGGGVIVVGGVYNAALTQIVVGVTRLLSDGSLDTAFNGSGYQVFDPSVGEMGLAVPTAMTVQPDGRIVVVGAAVASMVPAQNLDMFAARLLPGGGLDPAFGDGGVTRVPFEQGGSNSDGAFGVTATADGGLLLAGHAATTSGVLDIALARLDADGNLLPGFGTNGHALIGYDGGGTLEDRAAGVVVDRQGRFYVASQVAVATDNFDAAVLRVTATGALDPSFGSSGWHVFGLDSSPAFDSEFADALALDGSERVVMVGGAAIDSASSYDALVVRLTGERVFADGFEAQP